MLNYILSFFSPKILLNARPQSLQSTGLIILLSLFSASLILALVFKFLSAKKSADRLLGQALNKFFYLFLTFSIIGFLYVWLAYEGIPFLSMKLIFLSLIIIILLWLYFALTNLLIKIPKIKQEIKKKKEFKKYLP